jgi:hypothetical protein
VAESDNDSTLAHHKIEYEKAKAQWERSDRVALVNMDNDCTDHVDRRYW